MTIEKAMNVLRLDNIDEETKEIVDTLLRAVPGYIEAATGLNPEQQAELSLCETATTFLLRLWYYPENTDSVRLQAVIDNILKSITVLGRKNQ